MAAYKITIVKLTDGSVSFDLDAPDGERLISGHTLPRNFSIDVSRVGGMSAGPTLRRVSAAVPSRPWREEATSALDGLGLEVVDHNAGSHVQFRQDGKVLAEWWPNKGTTMMDGKRGPMCRTGEDVVAWMKTM
jgi:hypothetical protein